MGVCARPHERKRWLRVSLWLALALLAGCGDSNQSTEARGGGAVALPTPIESAESALAKLIDAARSGDCKRVARHIHGAERLSYCRFMKEAGALEIIARWDGSLEVFGTAALGEMTDVDGVERYIVLALDPQRRFKFVTVTERYGDRLDQDRAEAKVKQGIRALRDNDCDAFYLLSAQAIQPHEFCQSTWVRRFWVSVVAAERVSEQSLGGNGYISFFAVTADDSLYTVVLMSLERDFTFASAAPSS
jgi:hypothetical protein